MSGIISLAEIPIETSNADLRLQGGTLMMSGPALGMDRHVAHLEAFQDTYECRLPSPVYGDQDALAGLLQSRLMVSAARTGEYFDYEITRVLAERLSRPPAVEYQELMALYGTYRHARAVLESLVRVGLVFDAGNTVVLPGTPVSIQVMIGDADGFQRIWRGETPVLHSGRERLRVLVTSRLALELRVLRLALDLGGKVLTRSITRASLNRGRITTLDFDPFHLDDAHVEQLLLHASWSAPTIDDQDRDQELDEPRSHSLASSIESERRALVATAGLGWMVEHLIPRTCG